MTKTTQVRKRLEAKHAPGHRGKQPGNAPRWTGRRHRPDGNNGRPGRRP